MSTTKPSITFPCVIFDRETSGAHRRSRLSGLVGLGAFLVIGAILTWLAWVLAWSEHRPESPSFARDGDLYDWCDQIGGKVTWDYEGAAGGMLECTLAGKQLARYPIQPIAPPRTGG